MNILWKCYFVFSIITIILLMIHMTDINVALEHIDRQLSDVVTYDTLKHMLESHERKEHTIERLKSRILTRQL